MQCLREIVRFNMFLMRPFMFTFYHGNPGGTLKPKLDTDLISLAFDNV